MAPSPLLAVLSAAPLVLAVLLGSWNIERSLPSVAKLLSTSVGGHCTAFTVGEHYWVTAAHCIVPNMVIDGKPAQPVDVMYAEDVAMLKGGPLRPPLKLGEPPRRGQEVLGLGWGGPFRVPLYFVGQIVHLEDSSFVTNAGAPRMIFNTNYVPGMSGGPVLDRKGRVISVVLCGGDPAGFVQDLGCGATYPVLGRLVRRHVR